MKRKVIFFSSWNTRTQSLTSASSSCFGLHNNMITYAMLSSSHKRRVYLLACGQNTGMSGHTCWCVCMSYMWPLFTSVFVHAYVFAAVCIFWIHLCILLHKDMYGSVFVCLCVCEWFLCPCRKLIIITLQRYLWAKVRVRKMHPSRPLLLTV